MSSISNFFSRKKESAPTKKMMVRSAARDMSSDEEMECASLNDSPDDFLDACMAAPQLKSAPMAEMFSMQEEKMDCLME